MPAPGGRRAALLLLADGRFPAGGYAHSGCLEPAVTAGTVSDVASLERFVTGRLRTAGLVAAAFAAAACRVVEDRGSAREAAAELAQLDRELDARTPSPTQRRTSRALGRQLVRALDGIAPDVALDGLDDAPHQPIALGVAYATLELTPADAAVACLHESAAGPVAAAVRLLSVDPFATYGVLARVAPLVDSLAAEAVDCDVEDLPATAGPLLDIYAERHRHHRSRLFAS